MCNHDRQRDLPLSCRGSRPPDSLGYTRFIGLCVGLIVLLAAAVMEQTTSAFTNHAINTVSDKLYDATCGSGGYDDSPAGFLDYCRDNLVLICIDTVGNIYTVSGNNITAGTFTLYEVTEQ